jgi:phage protein D
VHLDDQDISAALHGLTLRLDSGDVPRATLDVIALDISTYSDDAQVHLPPATRDLLVRLGWTPPAEEVTDGAEA